MKPTVFHTTAITPASLVEAYEHLGRPATGRVAVKISTGEPGPGAGNWLDPALIKDLVHRVGGTIVESNTGYEGKRFHTDEHRQVAADHGYTGIADVDILDADGTMDLPTRGGGHLDRDIVGTHVGHYDFLIILSHFKGHIAGGFGGAIKNASIGMASSAGKLYIHSAGTTSATTADGIVRAEQDDFLESMAEAAAAVADHFEGRILYINVANKISVDCDCDANAAPAAMADLGVFASLDPVAVDKATTDAIWAAPDSADVIERIESRHGLHTLEHGEKIGLGSQDYELVEF